MLAGERRFSCRILSQNERRGRMAARHAATHSILLNDMETISITSGAHVVLLLVAGAGHDTASAVPPLIPTTVTVE